MSGIIEATNLQTDNIKSSGGTTAMTIDSSGRVLQPTKPSFCARHNGSSFNTNGATIAWNLTNGTYGSFDIGNNYNTSTYKYIVPITGVYWFQMESITNTNANEMTLQIRGGSDGTSTIQQSHITKDHSNWQTQQISVLQSCTAGDQIHCYQVGSVNWYGSTWGWFGGCLIG